MAENQTSVVTEARWLSENVGVRALDERILLRVLGDDAHSWLNGQITNDVREIKAGETVYALAIHVKGRVLSDLHVYDRAELGLAIGVPRQNLPALIEHFEKYVIMEDVLLEPDERTIIVTVQGPRAAAIDETSWPRFQCDRLGAGGFDVLVPIEDRDRAIAALSERASTLGGGWISEAGWELARIRAASPAIFADFGEDTYPQEAGLEDRAVSFQKGCYLGQEVVCMLENRGQLTRRLVQIESEQAFSRGDRLSDANGAAIGEVRSVLFDPDRNRTLGLAYVKRALAHAGAIVSTGSTEARVVRVVGESSG